MVGFGFLPKAESVSVKPDFNLLKTIYDDEPGLVSDKLKNVLEITRTFIGKGKARGLVLAYDEAQNMGDHAEKGEYPNTVRHSVCGAWWDWQRQDDASCR